MNVPTILRGSPATGSTARAVDSADVVTVRPVRAAFGPHVSLVSVDNQGRLWVRFSTAIVMLIAGAALMLIPLAALWWAGGGLVDSGQVSLTTHHASTTNSTPADPTSPAPTKLPLAGSGH